jgi:hypothetical protein
MASILRWFRSRSRPRPDGCVLSSFPVPTRILLTLPLPPHAARFSDTASQAGILALLSCNPFLSRLPSPLKTAFASLAGALFRMVLMPVDTLKTTMQTQGSRSAGVILRERVKAYGPGTLWAGAWATAAANFVGSFPWCVSLPVLPLLSL